MLVYSNQLIPGKIYCTVQDYQNNIDKCFVVIKSSGNLVHYRLIKDLNTMQKAYLSTFKLYELSEEEEEEVKLTYL